MAEKEWDYLRFKAAFFQKTGLDLERYKDKQMERRIRQLMQRENKLDFQSFYKYLASNSPAMERFMSYLTINTSEFFRDEKVYNTLQEEIFPELIRKFPDGLTIWSAGCSIGAEPYTVAIILDRLGFLKKTRIIATDVDDKALLIADKGCYSFKQLGKTSRELISSYFEKEKEEYCVKKAIKEAVNFRRHNLFTDKPINDCNMIFCRNVFIYFKPETQHFLLGRFSSVLKKSGFLVIGSAEYISNPSDFGLSKRFNTIYQKNS